VNCWLKDRGLPLAGPDVGTEGSESDLLTLTTK
jgi:hypothetical protein